MVDHVPLDPRDPPAPRPQLRTLTLLVGRMTTIKLTYWAALTAWEIAAPRDLGIAFAIVASAGAILWSIRSARSIDLRSGRIARGVATVSTTFATASVVAAPASIPLLLVERVRSAEGCAAQITCHGEAIWFWVATFLIGFLVIPAAFAIALKPE